MPTFFHSPVTHPLGEILCDFFRHFPKKTTTIVTNFAWLTILFISVLSAYFIQGNASTTVDQTCSVDDESCSACQDQENDCAYWATVGECENNPTYMTKFCPSSCGKCPGSERPISSNTSTCRDNHEQCEMWAETGECEANPNYMLKQCKLSCFVCIDPSIKYDLGVEQKLESKEDFPHINASAVQERIQKSDEYVTTTKLRTSLKRICKNTDEMCTIWALDGQCEKNNDMKKRCAPACHSCDHLGIEGRCPIDPNAPKAWEEGDLNKMFEKLTQEPYLSQYSVEILSSPATTGGPWVITMDDVVSATEAETLIELGKEKGFERSETVGLKQANGSHGSRVASGRTSSNTWCQEKCYNNTKATNVIQRLSNLTGIDERNSEYLQLLQYEPGQFYSTHHDYIDYHTQRQSGVRILTMYLYLNDVEAGGGTNFNKLDITVMPKRGRALLWPSVLNEDPNKKDWRTTHQALPVEKGIKYGANAWFHMNDFKTPHSKSCDN